MVVEDDEILNAGLCYNLQKRNIEPVPAYTVEEAKRLLSGDSYDLVLLDVNLPDGDGFQFAETVITQYDVPFIFLTAHNLEDEVIAGYRLGADDYITKPFSPLEMVARVKAQLRRARRYNEGALQAGGDVIDFSGIVIDRAARTCLLNDRPLSLTPLEFNILWLLCENRGKVISCEQLFRQVWGEKYFTNSNNTVMVHIRHLREKMGDKADKPKYIKTVWGVGYKIDG